LVEGIIRTVDRREELHVDDTYGGDLCKGSGPMRIDVELTGRGVDILV